MEQNKQMMKQQGITVTFEQAAKDWLAARRLFVKPSTYARYVHTLNRHILPYLGKEELQRLDAAGINVYLKMLLEQGRVDKNGGLAPKTVNDIYVIIKAVIRLAEDTYQISGRLSRHVNLHKKSRQIMILDTASRIRLESFLLSNSVDPLCTGILLCLYTGMRLGEICALKWENICLETGCIRISSTLQRIQNVETGGPRTKIICSPPKSLAGSREIPLPGFLLEILKGQLPKSDSNLYFLTGGREFIEPRTYQNHFKYFLKQNRLPVIPFHALRHTFATRCVTAGVDVKSLSEILGHSNVQMTLNYYVHPSLEDKRRQIELIAGNQ